MEAFWTIVVYAFVVGMAALGGFVTYYWFVIVPERELAARRAPAAGRQQL
jgi:hypothetical protein